MFKGIKIINRIVFLTWFALIAVLLYKNYIGIPLEKSKTLKGAFGRKTYWYDIYSESKKIGLASTSFERAGDEIIIKHEREIHVVKENKETLLIQKLRCLCNSYYSIKSFEYTIHFKGEKGDKISGNVDEGNIIFFIETPQKRKTRKISTEGKDFYLPVTLVPALHHKNPVPKTSYLIPMLNLINLSIDNMRIVLEEIRPLKVGQNILSLYTFRVGNSILWSNDKGIIVKEKLPKGITLYNQMEDIARDTTDRILFDYTSLPYFKANKIISDTEKLNLLKIRIEGFPLDAQLYENSLVTLRKNFLTIEKEEIERMKKRTYTLPYENNKLKEYLKPDEWVLSNYKPLQDTGRIYAKGRKNDPYLFAKYLNGYLYNLIKSTPRFVLLDSKTILQSLLGDYLERTIMFASYSRAGGLPTRLMGGLVYMNGYFYFHTWPEVWLDKWIPIDPTLAQFPADVTHIPLREGTLRDIVSIIPDLRNMTIEILETL